MHRRFVIITEGQSHPTPAKMAAGLLRYRSKEVAAILDSTNKGKTAGQLFGAGGDIPVIGSLDEAEKFHPDSFLIGITPAGGKLPAEWREVILEAIRRKMDIYSGMHTLLCDDAEFVAAAKLHSIKLTDLRKPPDDLSVNTCQAPFSSTFRIHTVGSDCNCGKKVTALEMQKFMELKGLNSAFIATGQTGILISGKGIAMDHVISDYVAGAAERLVLENADADYLVIEGQGAIAHPLYSGVTCSMLHGFAPQVLILCHQVDRKIMRGTPNVPVPPLNKLIELYEKLTEYFFPAKIVGIALNTTSVPVDRAAEIIAQTESALGLPATDVIRFGPEKIVQACLEYQNRQRGKL